MRLIAEHPERDLVGRFLDYLTAKGIGGEIRSSDAGWGLWVYDEDACKEVRRDYTVFLSDPADSRYTVATVPVAAADAADPALPLPRPVEADRVRSAASRVRQSGAAVPVTMVLLVLSVAATLPILLDLPVSRQVEDGLRADPRWIRQWWRLVTPAFMHFNWLHIIFNMLWLRELGSVVERAKGGRFLALFFLATAAVSNYTQMVAGGEILFGGMSGVVYGLFGYIWIKARFFPEEGFAIDPLTVSMLMLWFMLGWTGLAGPIANWAHGFGLGVGGALALAPGWLRRPPPLADD